MKSSQDNFLVGALAMGKADFLIIQLETAPPHNCLSTIVETLNYICMGGEHASGDSFFGGGGCCQNML